MKRNHRVIRDPWYDWNDAHIIVPTERGPHTVKLFDKTEGTGYYENRHWNDERGTPIRVVQWKYLKGNNAKEN